MWLDQVSNPGSLALKSDLLLTALRDMAAWGCYNPHINHLSTGGLFPRYMLDKSICPFRDVRSILSLLF